MIECLPHVLCAEGSPVGGFQRHDEKVGRTQRRVRDQRNVRRAVEQDVVIKRGDFLQRIDQ